jgi:hypothetical protein
MVVNRTLGVWTGGRAGGATGPHTFALRSVPESPLNACRLQLKHMNVSVLYDQHIELFLVVCRWRSKNPFRNENKRTVEIQAAVIRRHICQSLIQWSLMSSVRQISQNNHFARIAAILPSE